MAEETAWRNSIVRKLLFIGIIIWIVLAIIFGFYDLQISMGIVDESNYFGNFGRKYGEAPGYGIIAVALVIFIGSFFSNLKKQRIGAYIVSGIFLVLFMLGFLVDDEKLILIGGFVSVSVLSFIILTPTIDWKGYRTLAIVILLLAIINPILFVNITKPLCGRVRFRNLDPEYLEYTPWFLPPGPDPDNLSFPSGHAAMGWMLLPLLIPLRNKKTLTKILWYFLIIGWGVFVGLSRIIVGAHYASDVLFSTGVAFTAVILLYKKYYLK